MVTCQLFFAQQYQLGFVVTVLNMYTIHSESHLGFNNNDRTSKGDFPKNFVFFLTLSSSPLLPTLREKPFLSMLGNVLRLPFLSSPTRSPFCLSLLSRNGTKTVAFAGRVEIFQERWSSRWISHEGDREFQRILTPVVVVYE